MTTTKNTTPLEPQVKELLGVITGFDNLLKLETGALRKHDFQTVDKLQADKRHYARQYHDKISALFERKQDFLGLDISMRERLIAARTQFTVTLNENMYALDVAKNSTKRLIDRILDAARSAVAIDRQTNYSSVGKSQAYKSATLSLQLDKNL